MKKNNYWWIMYFSFLIFVAIISIANHKYDFQTDTDRYSMIQKNILFYISSFALNAQILDSFLYILSKGLFNTYPTIGISDKLVSATFLNVAFYGVILLTYKRLKSKIEVIDIFLIAYLLLITPFINIILQMVLISYIYSGYSYFWYMP